MSDAPLVPDGTYRARAQRVKYSTTSDGVPYVEVELAIIAARSSERTYCNGLRLHWRGPMSRFGAIRSARALVAMGVLQPEMLEEKHLKHDCHVPPPSLDFLIDVTSIECDEREAAGKWRTFARNPRRP